LGDGFDRQLIDFLPRMRRFALALTRNAAAADDLVQVACEKALAGKARFTAGTRFDAWIFRIMRNAWIDQARRRKTSGETVALDEEFEFPGGDSRAETENALVLKATLAAIADLPDDQRDLLILVSVEGLSYREAADVLDVPIGTVMSRLARARRKLGAAVGIDPPARRSSVRADGVQGSDSDG